MALPGFIFGGNTGVTPEKLKRDRSVAEALLAGSARSGAPRNVGEGLNSIGQALMYRVAKGRADEGEKVASEKQSEIWKSLSGAMSANGGGMGFGSATGPIGSASPAPQGTSTASIPSGERAAYIRSGLTSRGLPGHIADGFLANFQDESGLDSGINERNPIVPGSRGGFGLYQLTGPRRREYEAYASQRGVDPSDVDAQMDFLVGELQGSERAAAEKIFATTDTAGAAQAIVTNFLRPAAEHRNSRVARYAGLGGGVQASQQPEPVQVASLDPSAGVAEATGLTRYTGPPLRDPNPAISIAPTGMPGSSAQTNADIERFHAENGTTPVQYGQGTPSGPAPGNVVGERPDMQSNAIASALGIVGQPQQRGMTPVAAALRGAPAQAQQSQQEAPVPDQWAGLRGQGGQPRHAQQPVQVAQAGGGMQYDPQALMGILSNPWASEEQRALAGNLLQFQMKQNAPPSASERLAEERFRYEQGRDAATLKQWQRLDDRTLFNPMTGETRQVGGAAGAGPSDLGLNPQYGVDAQGNPVLIQIGKDGKAVQTQMPNGVTLSKEPIRLDAGTHFVLLDPITRQSIGTIPKENRQEAADTAAGTVEGRTEAERQVAASGDAQSAQNALDLIESIRNDPYRARGTGGTSVFNNVPGTGGYDFQLKVEQAKGGAFLQAIQQMKGLGALSNNEGAAATQAITRMNTAASEEGFLAALDDYEKIVRQGLARAQANMPGATVGASGNPTQPATATAPGSGSSVDDLLKKYGG